MLIVFLYRKSRVLSVWRGNKYFCFLERVFLRVDHGGSLGGLWVLSLFDQLISH